MSIPDTLTPDQRQTLSAQVIDENGPGTILRDFEALLDFIGPKGIEVGGKHQLLPMKRLVEFNARLARPIEIDLKRPVQKSYPHINGLYLLLRACGLARVESSGKKQRLVIDEEALQSWKTLNPTERYFTLLETWLLLAKTEILGERSRLFDSPFIKCYEFWGGIPERELKVAGDRNTEERIRYIPGLYNVALLELFGLLSVKHCKPAEGGGWCIASVQRTAFGNALLGLLFELFQNSNLLFGEDYETEEEADEVRIGDLHIRPGTAIDFLYDFGDQWLFQVQLERIDPADSTITKPKLIDSYGEAPEQYPDTDEWF